MKVKIILIITSALIIGSIIGYNFRSGYFKNIIPTQKATEILQEEHHSPPSVVIEPGSAVEEASYIIFQDDEGWVYAKNGSTGSVEFSGTDAATVIQSSINALPTSGGKIFIKAGTYGITSQLILSGLGSSALKQIVIEGESANGTTIRAIGSNNIFKLNNNMALVLRDLKLILPTSGSGYAIYGAKDGATQDSSKRSIFENIHIEGGDNYAIYMKNFFDLRMSSVYINTGGNGIMFENDWTGSGTRNYGNSHIDDLFINPSGTNTIAVNIKRTAGGNMNLIDFDRLTIYSTTPGEKTGIKIIAGDYITFKYLQIENVNYSVVLTHADSVPTPIGTFNTLFENGYMSASSLHFNVSSYSKANTFRNLACVALEVTTDLLDDDNTDANVPTRFEYITLVGGKWKSSPFSASSATIIENLNTWGKSITQPWKRENSGNALVVNGSWIAHSLVSIPSKVLITPTNKRFAAATSANSTHFQIGLWDIFGDAISVGELISWYAEV